MWITGNMTGSELVKNGVTTIKVLHLTLKKKWFDMIASGAKKDEYREIKPYWDKRLNRDYDAVQFRNGYSSNAPIMLVELCWISKGVGKKEWGAPDYPVYILSLGRIINKGVERTPYKKTMKYRLKTISGWWKGQFGIPMSGPDCGDVLEFDTKDDALTEIRNIPAIVSFDGIVPVTHARKDAKSQHNKSEF